jgi:hypothetical protein
MNGARTVLLLSLAACSPGSGSDVGPSLPKIPDASTRVVVLDDQGRGVVGATVTAGGARTITGRNGRGDFLATPRGRLVVDVDVDAAAARSGDQLADLRVALDVTGPDLPQVLHVADLDGGTPAVLALGTQGAPATVLSSGGARVQIAAGASVGSSATGTTVTVAAGDLQGMHLPGNLPVAPGGALLFGRGVCVAPAGVTFAPAADLELADDLGVGAGTARLFRLDPQSGEWSELAVGGTGAGGRITAAGAVAGGGVYAFAVEVAAATVTGRVLDAAPVPNRVADIVPDAYVRIDTVAVVTGGDGRFVATGVPATLADGSPRALAIELFAGGAWLPVRRALAAAVSGATVDLGDLQLDTMPAGNVRVQQVLRGRALALRPARASSLRGEVVIATASDAAGQTLFEDVPADYFGFQDGLARDFREVVYGQSVGFLERGRRWLDASQFFVERAWYEGARRTRAYVSDALGGGPIEQAWVIQGDVPGQGAAELTQEGGTVFVTRDFAGRATAVNRSARDGRVVVHAVSIVTPDGEHLELPLQRAWRAPVGAFERHGLVGGDVVGADPARGHELRVTRTLSTQEWWDEQVPGAGIGAPPAVPVDVDPAVVHDRYVAGVPVPRGNIAIAETSTPGGLKTLQRLGLASGVEPLQGGRLARDVVLDAAATSTFVVPGALAGAPPELDASQLSVALALLQPEGRVVDVVRGLRGNHAVNGTDLALTLPPLDGALAGNGWLVLLGGSWPSNGTTIRVANLVSLPRPTPSSLPSSPLGDVRFAPFPTLTSPANGAVVAAADGITVQFALPPGTVYGVVELRADDGTERLLWQAWVPPVLTQFAFVRLPPEAPTPLVPGRTYTLTVAAYFGDGAVIGADGPYRCATTFLQSIGPVETGLNQVTSRAVQVTTN